MEHWDSVERTTRFIQNFAHNIIILCQYLVDINKKEAARNDNFSHYELQSIGLMDEEWDGCLKDMDDV
jgi:hypothetical protein